MTTAGRDAVFLLTDYGGDDEFAGVLRAVILRHAPQARIVDLTHGIPPFDVRAGALMLSRCVTYLGPGVVVAVVDPGVGSGRRAVAVTARGAPGPAGAGPLNLVGPDNGLLGFAVDALGGVAAAVALPGTVSVGSTFDGRDLFAPVAARLWAGATLNDVGMPIDPESLVRLPAPRMIVSPAVGTGLGSVEAEVLWVDRFGNAQLAAVAGDAARAGLAGTLEIRTGTTTRRAVLVPSFAALEPDDVGLLLDANGHLALVCRLGSAATVLGVRPGDIVTVSQIPGRSPGTGISVPDDGRGAS